MKTRDEILGQMLRKNYPLTFKLLDEATQRAIDNKINKIEACVLRDEVKDKSYDEKEVISDQFRTYLSSLGFYAVMVSKYINQCYIGNGEYPQGLKIQIWMIKDAEISEIIKK